MRVSPTSGVDGSSSLIVTDARSCTIIDVSVGSDMTTVNVSDASRNVSLSRMTSMVFSFSFTSKKISPDKLPPEISAALTPPSIT